MNGTRAIIGVLLLSLAAGFAWFYLQQSRPIPPAEIMRRAAESAPEWANYQEDIKAQIGARPVAEWLGKPIEIRRGEGAVQVTFELDGPWAGREAAIPVLLRDPLGVVHRSSREVLASPRVTYEYLDGQGALTTVPWVELRYPHKEQRVMLDADGHWIGESS